mmetsp:Transcript_20230/g.26142  ORF Transcript_20230/g.26142 Transcript_20230/m.26142 type:complete len:234 (+) Transcript_20230:1843-2544(+)
MRRNIRSINLLVRTNGAFDCPSVMEPKPHFHLVARHPLEQAMGSSQGEVEEEVLVARHLRNGAHETVQGLVCKRADVSWGHLILQLPSQEEGVPNILICSTIALSNHTMQNSSYAVHKKHHLLLQTLCGVGEIPNVTKPKNGPNLITTGEQVQPFPRVSIGRLLAHLQIPRDDRCASFSKTHPHQTTNFIDGVQELSCLHARLELISSFIVESKGVISDFLNQIHHSFYWHDN